MLDDCPIFVNYRKESIHFIWNIFEVRRLMVTHVDGFFTIAAAKLGDISNSR